MAFVAGSAGPAAADQGGVSFWLPGIYGSLAAAPLQPGWSLGAIYLHEGLGGGGDVAASRAIRFPPGRTTDLTVNLDAKLRGTLDAGILIPSYTFAQPVLGGQFTINVLTLYGRNTADIDGRVTGALGPIGFATERTVGQSIDAWGDVYLQPTLRWNKGVDNYMVYAMTNLPVGAYDASRLVNMGLGHWSIDAGGGYTYFNPQSGNEFSFVTGFTYNFVNPSIDYQNGIDWHLDWGTSHFFTKQIQIGLVGFAYQQITGDSGSGARLGPFKSRVFGIGPQIGYLFPVGDMQGYINLRGYGEFAAQHRPDGWNLWLTLSLSPKAQTPPSSTTRRISLK